MGRILKFIVIFFCLLSFVIPQGLYAYVSVRGYVRKDGTYVSPHVRSNPNGLKYDNYSWTPSQGLYNKSYGTRGSKWDTPTWNTDPNYYEGKSIYDSSHGVGNYSGYSINKRPKGMSKREFNSLTNGTTTNTAPLKQNSSSLITSEINQVKNKYYKNPDGFRERLIDQISDYAKSDRGEVANYVYSMLPDIK